MAHRKKNMDANAMIVEDEKDLCFLLERILQRQNLKTACANTLSDASKFITRFKPRVLFLDNNLPDGSGTDFIGKVKSINPSTKIIMITAYDTQNDIDKAFHNGADYFISKPFNIGSIKKVLDVLELSNTG